GGRSLKGLAAELNRRGVPSPCSGALWERGVVWRILRNEAYAGVYVWNKKHEGKYYRLEGGSSVASVPRKEWSVKNAPKEWVRIEGAHEALVSPELAAEARARLAQNRDRSTPCPEGGPWLLPGLVYCECGASMYGRRPLNWGKRYTRYVCSRYVRFGKKVGGCQNNYAEQDELVWGVTEVLRWQWQGGAGGRMVKKSARGAGGRGRGGAVGGGGRGVGLGPGGGGGALAGGLEGLGERARGVEGGLGALGPERLDVRAEVRAVLARAGGLYEVVRESPVEQA